MKAMILTQVGELGRGEHPLVLRDVPRPVAAEDELLVRVTACGVCHTELDEIEGRTAPSSLPRILGHQVVGRVIEKAEVRGQDSEGDVRGPKSEVRGQDSEGDVRGPRSEVRGQDSEPATSDIGHRTSDMSVGDRVGVAWIYSACGTCRYCLSDRENLCPDFRATGRDVDGGYAEFMVVREAFAHPIPDVFPDVEAAPLLCAGAIGYRSMRLTGLVDGDPLGLTGFGASAHLVLMMVRHRFPASAVFVFTRSEGEREFARELGAAWAGDITDRAPEPLAAIIDTTPAWKPIVESLANLRPGGHLVINALRKEARDQDALSGLDYPTHLWMEKQVVSVANVTRRDVREFLGLAAEMRITPSVDVYPLADANRALMEIKARKIRGAKVLVVA